MLFPLWFNTKNTFLVSKNVFGKWNELPAPCAITIFLKPFFSVLAPTLPFCALAPSRWRSVLPTRCRPIHNCGNPKQEGWPHAPWFSDQMAYPWAVQRDGRWWATLSWQVWKLPAWFSETIQATYYFWWQINASLYEKITRRGRTHHRSLLSVLETYGHRRQPILRTL